MKIQKSYKFRIYPNKAQAHQLAVEFGCSRFVWNYFLNKQSKIYQGFGNKVGFHDHSVCLTVMKKMDGYKWLSECVAVVLIQKLTDLDTAYTNFYKKRAEYPKFKKKTHAQSVRYQLDQRQVANNFRDGELIKLPKLGKIKVNWTQKVKGIPKMATVSQNCAGEYFVSFMCEIEQSAKPKTGLVCGVDVGVKDVVVLDGGYKSGSPKATYKLARKLKLAQRDLSRKLKSAKKTKIKNSKRLQKARVKVAVIHQRIANIRKDFLHKETSRIVNDFDTIFIEDLNVKGMMKNRKLSKAVADVGMFELKRQLIYKAAWYGKEVIKINRWFPSSKTCSCCGFVKPKLDLGERVFSCESCGYSEDRDINAAKNIKACGMGLRGAVNQLGSEPSKMALAKAAVKREESKNQAKCCLEQRAA